MKRVIPFLFFIACDRPAAVEPDPLFELASKCIEQMTSCEDWTPKPVESYLSPLVLEECERFDYDCERRNNKRTDAHEELKSRPPFASACEIKTKTCVEIIAAVASKKVENHYHQER